MNYSERYSLQPLPPLAERTWMPVAEGVHQREDITGGMWCLCCEGRTFFGADVAAGVSFVGHGHLAGHGPLQSYVVAACSDECRERLTSLFAGFLGSLDSGRKLTFTRWCDETLRPAVEVERKPEPRKALPWTTQELFSR
jgi:hypothetical protein